MAIYHLITKPISRSQGRSATAALLARPSIWTRMAGHYFSYAATNNWIFQSTQEPTRSGLARLPSCISHVVAPVLAGAVALASTACAFTTQPIANLSPPFAIDQSKYFASPEAEQAEFRTLVAEVETFPVEAAPDDQALEARLRRAEGLLIALDRHSAFLYLRASRDIDDRVDLAASDQADAAKELLVAKVESTMFALGGSRFRGAATANPALRKYAFMQQQAEHRQAHQLTPAQKTAADTLGATAASSLWTLYEKTMRSTLYAQIETPEGHFDAKQDARTLNANPDRSIRRSAWEARMTGYASRAEIYAGILIGMIRLQQDEARLRHFADAPSMVYFDRGLDRAAVTEALAAIKSHAGLQKDYQSMQARHFSAMTGEIDVHIWDMPLPEPGFAAPRMSFQQTAAASLAALAPLGKDYLAHFSNLLNLANGRLDVGAAQGNRGNGGFSVSAPGVPTGLFVESYGSGLLGDSRVIVHEGGHAVHEQLMHEQGVNPFYLRGPHWMFEAYATLNEFLLYDYLYRTATDPRAKAYYLRALIDDMAFSLFGSAEEGTLEQSLYDGVETGAVHNAADIDMLTLSIWSDYEIWPGNDPLLAHYWITRSLMVQDPMYQVNYMYAGMLATKMFDLATRDAKLFQSRFMALLRAGFPASSSDLLKQFFGRDVSQQELVESGMDLMADKIRQLGALYQHFDGARLPSQKASTLKCWSGYALPWCAPAASVAKESPPYSRCTHPGP